MITMQALNYGKVLYSLNLSHEIINNTKNLITQSEILLDVLANPTISISEKNAVIGKLFDKDMVPFIRLLCENNRIGMAADIIEAYDSLNLEKNNKIRAKLFYVTKPAEEEIEQIKNMICKNFNKEGVCLELIEDKTLIGGFVLCVCNTEYNRSIKGNLLELQRTLSRR